MRKSRDKAAEPKPKIELLFGLNDGSKIKLAHDEHVYVYRRSDGVLIDEYDVPISSEILVYMINHPEELQIDGAGDNIYQQLSGLVGKMFLNILVYLVFFVISCRLFFMQSNTDWGVLSVCAFICMILCLIAIGACAGVVFMQVIKNRDIITG